MWKASKDRVRRWWSGRSPGCIVWRLERRIRQWRQRYTRPILKKLWQWLEQQKDACPESSALGKAIAYTLKRRVMLSRFLKDGALPLNNNRAERAIRPVAMGRSLYTSF
ncbi:MAG: IS66 family transposase [Serratia sp. (in: enterobacteria)]|uniref:IS66 family transposase n=1 Tax=Serratia sp. (in: enterobacteria) TaxID=616 RepID=UPI003F2E3791